MGAFTELDNQYVWLDLSARGSAGANFAANRIALKCETVAINTSKQVLSHSLPGSGFWYGESKTAALDLGMTDKTVSLNGVITEQNITKNWDLELYNIFKKYPNQKMWVNSHRVEPNMFNNQSSRPGTVIVDKEMFGAYHHDFKDQIFEQWANEFTEMNDFEIPKGEGVSGLIRKKDWDEIGGNDPLFAPASWDDMDLFLRMLNKGFKFILTSKSMVYHFGARGSHRLEENDGKSSTRQIEAERVNAQKWFKKWKAMPKFDQYEMICGLKS